MMGPIHKIGLFLFVLTLCSCVAKKTVTESRSETDYAGTMRLVVTKNRSDSLVTAMVSEQTMTENESDSIVEKLRERIVTDSCGNIVLHEKEFIQEHYKNKGKKNISSDRGSVTESQTASRTKSVEGSDSIQSATRTDIVKEVRYRPPCVVYLACILVLLLFVGFIISKIKK